VERFGPQRGLESTQAGMIQMTRIGARWTRAFIGAVTERERRPIFPVVKNS
jgi:hypothetical protein